jgi:hypothetical protein
MLLTYYVPNDEPGRWNPILKACKLAAVAKLWASPNFHFPWPKGPTRSRWPTWTLFDAPDLESIGAELESFTKAKLEAVPATMLSSDAEDAHDCRDELWSGLDRLRHWLGEASAPEKGEGLGWQKRGNALLVLMDGDQ